MERTDTQAFVVRLAPEEHAALRGCAVALETSMNEILRRALREFLAGEGRREQVRAAAAHVQKQYAEALDKLADL